MTQPAPRVTIVIPTYNALAFLPETLASVYQQTYQDFEVIVVDDGSADGSLDWLKAQNFARLRALSQENQGVSVARNRGVREARGEFIAFLDADDLWEPEKLEKQLAVFAAKPDTGLVHTGTRILEADGSLGATFGVSAEGDTLTRVIRSNPIRCGSTPLVKKACFEEVGLFDSSLLRSEDWEMWVRVAAKYPFGVVDEPLVRYRQHASNKSKDYKKLLQNMERIVEKIYEQVPAELQSIKAEAYGFIYLHTAWRALFAGDALHTRQWLRQAQRHNPRLRFAKNALHLALRIRLLVWFGLRDWPRPGRARPLKGRLPERRTPDAGSTHW